MFVNKRGIQLVSGVGAPTPLENDTGCILFVSVKSEYLKPVNLIIQNAFSIVNTILNKCLFFYFHLDKNIFSI